MGNGVVSVVAMCAHAENPRIGRKLGVLCMAGALSLGCFATTYYVSPDGDDTAAGTSWATALKTPKKGFGKVSGAGNKNHTVLIAPGDYTLTDAIGCTGADSGYRVTVRGSTGNPNDVVLRAGGTYEVLRLAKNITVANLTIADGSNSGRDNRAAGVRVGSFENNGLLSVVSNCVITGCHNAYENNKVINNYTNVHGAAAYVWHNGLIVDCVVSNNTAAYRGCGITLDGANACALRCTITDNVAVDAGDSGCPVVGMTTPSKKAEIPYGGGRLVDCVVQSNRTAYCAGARDVKYIEGCTFRGNVLDPAKGSHSSSALNLTVSGCVVTNCTFADNVAEKGFATMYLGHWDAKIVDSTFVGNVVSNYGAGVGITAKSTSPNCRTKIENCFFAGNVANSAAGGGGAIRVNTGYVDVSGCTFTNNTAKFGGAMDVIPANSDASLVSCSDCLFIGNTANDCGGGARVANAAQAMFDGCTFMDNKATLDMTNTGNDTSVNAGGGGVFMYSQTADGWCSVSNCVFSGNSGTRGGGFGSTWNHTIDARGFVADCVFTDNVSFRQGGGLSIRVNESTDASNPFVIRNSLFAFNRTAYPNSTTDSAGAGILLVVKSPVVVENCTIVSNVTAFNKSGGLHMPWNGRLVNNIVAYNLTKGGSAQDVLNWVSSSGATFTNCCTYPATASVLTAANGCINANPKFVDPANGDFRISASSPCKDAGLSASWMANAFDLAGKVRVSGSAPDIGCYEYVAAKGLLLIIR